MLRKKKDSGFLFLLSLLVLVSIVFLSGCGKQPASSPKEAVKQEQQQVDFNVNLTSPDKFNKPMQAFAKAVEERTGGKVKLNLYYSNSLLPVPEQITGLQSGIADISVIIASTHTGSLPLTEIIGWPFMGYSKYENAFNVQMKLLKDVPELGAEFSKLGLRVFAGTAIPPMDLMVTSKKTVLSPDDVKGMKIISTKPVPSALIQKWGGTPVSIQISDYYMSLERGVADAALTAKAGALAFGITGLNKQYVQFGEQGFFVENYNHVISDKAWNKMTPETQAIFMEEAAILSAGEEKGKRGETDVAHGMLKKAGEVTLLTPEQVAKFSKDADEVHQAKIAELEKKGLPAKKVYDAIKKAAAEMK